MLSKPHNIRADYYAGISDKARAEKIRKLDLLFVQAMALRKVQARIPIDVTLHQ